MVTTSGLLTAENSNPYSLLEPIGEGLTAVIWRGVEIETSEEVALKLLRAGASVQVANLFWQEVEALAQLNRIEREIGDSVYSVPRLRGVQRVNEPRFIAMDLARGKPLTNFFDAENSLSEVQALVVMDQLLRVLDFLHVQMKQTRLDFSPRDIFVALDSEVTEPRLWILDWAQLKDTAPETIAADLAHVGALFYQLATQHAADPRGEAEHVLVERDTGRWEELTTTTRQIIVCALHPNPQTRYDSAAGFRRDVQAQLAAWARDWDDLLAQAQDELNRIELDSASAARIENALDLAAHKAGDSEKISYYRAALEKKTHKASLQYITGQEHYQRGEYARAVEVWQKEAVTLERLELWRWSLVARVGAETREQFPAIRAALERAQDHLNALETGPALEILDRLSNDVSSSALETLGLEATAREHVAHARRTEKSSDPEEWQQAAASYAFADTCLDALPYGKLLRDQEGWGSLTARGKILQQRHAMRAQLLNARADIAEELERDWEKGLLRFQDALQNDPTNEALAQLCLDVGRRHQERGDNARAVEILELGLLWGSAPEFAALLRESEIVARRALGIAAQSTTAWFTDPSPERAAHAVLQARALVVELQREANANAVTFQRLELLRTLDQRLGQLRAVELEKQVARIAGLETERDAVVNALAASRSNANQADSEIQKIVKELQAERELMRGNLERREIQLRALLDENQKLKDELAQSQAKRQPTFNPVVLPPPLADALRHLQHLSPDSLATAEFQLKKLADEYAKKGGAPLEIHITKQVIEVARVLRKPLQNKMESILLREAWRNETAAGTLSSREGLDYLKKNPLPQWLRDERDRSVEATRAFQRGDMRRAFKLTEQGLHTLEIAALTFQYLWRDCLGDDPALMALAPLLELERQQNTTRQLYAKYEKASNTPS